MPPAFRRGWEREGKPQIDALARASGRQPATRGRLFAVSGTRGRTPWRPRAKVRASDPHTQKRHICRRRKARRRHLCAINALVQECLRGICKFYEQRGIAWREDF